MSGIADPDWCKYCSRWMMGGACTKKGSKKCYFFKNPKKSRTKEAFSPPVTPKNQKKRKKVNPPPDG